MAKKAKKAKSSAIYATIQRDKLGASSDDKHFVVCDGQKLTDLKDLASALQSMDDGAYAHHANEEKNDFVNWVNDVFGHEDLAQELQNCSDKQQAELVVLRHIIKHIKYDL